MKSITPTILAATALAFTTTARVITNRQSKPVPQSQNDLLDAVRSWQAETGVVSAFLDNAKQFHIDKRLDLLSRNAIEAHASGFNGMMHKRAIESLLCGGHSTCECLDVADGKHCNDDIHRANARLVDALTFQSVVDRLGAEAANPGVNTFQNVDEINNGHQDDAALVGGRCDVVLPAIEVYFSEVSEVLIAQFGDHSLEGVKAIRPNACGLLQIRQDEHRVAQAGCDASETVGIGRRKFCA